jgi:hypothetical protein
LEILYQLLKKKKMAPAKIKMGRNWYQSAGIALVLGRWTFFFILKGPAEG